MSKRLNISTFLNHVIPYRSRLLHQRSWQNSHRVTINGASGVG